MMLVQRTLVLQRSSAALNRHILTTGVRYAQTQRRPLPIESTAPAPTTTGESLSSEPTKQAASDGVKIPERPKSWLTRKVESSPAAMKWFLGFTNALGYGSPKQIAGRRSFAMYEQICAIRPDEERLFWQQDCSLPPTFQSWFTVTNLHVWMLTVRLRSLPPTHGKAYIQGLIDHFFIDIEDRIRAVLQPSANSPPPYTFDTTFYTKPTTTTPTGEPKKLGKAPDRLVTQQMKIFKEQWAGMGLSLDLSLMQSDMEMAAAIWRNLLGARGARGILYDATSSSIRKGGFRRSVNLVGGQVVNVAKVDVEQEEMKDDGSGVHDFPPEESDKYLAYPELMLTLVSYIRRELVRLEKLSDKDIMEGGIEVLKFGKVRPSAGSHKRA
ncbi:hypothetical protein AX16_010619 [Volvariella volvacea WC 439]|nr:hypothetical protein AX16_010619 [Volvariella volvacea WC 439]